MQANNKIPIKITDDSETAAKSKKKKGKKGGEW